MSNLPKPKQFPLRFLFDENVDARLVSYLKEKGYEVSFVPKGLKNGKVFALAKETASFLVTNDRDFTDSNRYPSSETVGIIVFSIHPPVLSSLISAIKNLLSKANLKDTGKLWIVSEKEVEIVGL